MAFQLTRDRLRLVSQPFGLPELPAAAFFQLQRGNLFPLRVVVSVLHYQMSTNPEPTTTSLADLVKRLNDHALSHYAFGWDAVIECLCEADIEAFVRRFMEDGGAEANLIEAAAKHFHVPTTVVRPDQWAVVISAVDGTSVSAFDSETAAREHFESMVGRPAPASFQSEFNGVSDFGASVTLHKPANMVQAVTDSASPSSPLVTRQVAVLGAGSLGPVFHMVRLNVTQAQADSGHHYELAKTAGYEAGLEDPLIAFDQFDPATCQLSRIATEMTALRVSGVHF